MHRRLTILALIPLLVTTCIAGDKKKDPNEIGDRDVGKGVNFYSIEKEMAMGQQLALEVQKQSRMVDDPIVGEYINRIGQNLARNSDAKMPFTFKIIDSDSVNAFTLPGGHVFVNSGLIRLAETEAELAGAMAHEIGARGCAPLDPPADARADRQPGHHPAGPDGRLDRVRDPPGRRASVSR